MKLSQEPDHVNQRVVVIVAAAVVVVSLLGVLFAWWLLRSTANQTHLPGGPSEGARFGRPPTELSGVEMGMFQSGFTEPGPTRRARQHLQRYGWVDPAHSRVHIPIGRAMELYALRHDVPATDRRPVGFEEPPEQLDD